MFPLPKGKCRIFTAGSDGSAVSIVHALADGVGKGMKLRLMPRLGRGLGATSVRTRGVR
ncbi:hypothetical protein BOSEA31B_14830 [Hyphomicrobiales bacterium]|nr:hypothetical protein BOSEA31B_14830 [Hyphomicrobiales bacterium]CAH1701320.1 hypothetical protein BOSEA1005_21019 [Hyphomicrobiales bacterium]CAI0345281.1 hypothetical protein BO1005MUT1_380076 [Hyphomicrobiales bacterium]